MKSIYRVDLEKNYIMFYNHVVKNDEQRTLLALHI